MSKIVWLNDDSLRHWYGTNPAIYVFDDAKLESEHWSLKRIAFIYECLLELPVEIKRGDPVEQVFAFQNEHHADSILTTNTPDPHLRSQIDQLRDLTTVELVELPEFIHLTDRVDLRRFSKYFVKAQPALHDLETNKL